MDAVSFDNLAAVAAVAFVAPLVLGLAPALRVPSVLLEIGAGVALGPSVLGWVEADAAVNVLSLIGVGFLLLLAGLEIEVDRLRGAVLRLALTGFAVSFGIAVAVGYGLDAVGVVGAPFLVAVILSATSLAVVLPLLKDTGLAGSPFGQMVIAAASIADVATVIMLSLFFSEETAGVGVRLALFALFGLVCVGAGIAIAVGARVPSLSAALLRLQDTTAQIRVRGAFVLLMVFSILAQRFGLEAILGTFLAGMLLKLADRDDAMTHSHFHEKLTEAGFGFFIPVFFVASGLRLDAGALVSDSSTLLHVPVLVVALYVIRGLPALLYRGLLGGRRALAAGLLQSTTLSFVLIASQIGQELGLLGPSDVAALTAAALVSVLVNPVVALAVLGVSGDEPSDALATASP
jgi:Kef-type K+ transport system membrane component KefB